MKTTLFLTAALLASAVSASAQPSFGLKAGINISNLSTNNTEGTEPENRTGFVGGVFVTLPVGGIFAIQPEVLVGTQGAKFTEDGETAKLQLNYVQVPVLARIKAGNASPVSFLVGPSFGFRTSAKFTVDGVDEEPEIDDEVEKTDLGLVTGVEVAAGRLVLDARYTWGLRNIAKDSGTDTAKNRVVSLTAGIRF